MEKYWYWLCSQKDLYRNHIKKLLLYFETPKNVYEASDKELERCIFLKNEQIMCLKKGKRKEITGNEKLDNGIRFVSAEHKEYPKRLLEISDYPYGLFVKGNLPKDNKPSVAIVGARRCTAYGKWMALECGRALASAGVQVVSGMALGIDCHGQQAAIESGGGSFAVLGSGVDVCYPAENRRLYEKLERNGGLLSEFSPGTQPLPFHFPMRNRIISGLCKTVLVVEAKERSGSLITADFALEQGRDVLAVPGRVGDALSGGCNRLIAQGAGIILSKEHLLDILHLYEGNMKNKKKNKIPLETKENLLYSCLDFQPLHLDGIVKETKLSIQEVMQILAILIIKGYVKEPMKNYYIKVSDA